jgi:hypothetical protein
MGRDVQRGVHMASYRVKWEIDLEADSPREAAEKALAIQRDPESIATVFWVWEGFGGNYTLARITKVDLSEDE